MPINYAMILNIVKTLLVNPTMKKIVSSKDILL